MRPHFQVFGFPVRISPWVLILVVFFGSDLVTGALLIAALLGSVLVHELGHAFMFRRYGIRSFIQLSAFGGFTMPISGGQLDDRQHIKVSLAGPLTQLSVLGIPSLAALFFLDVSLALGNVLAILIFFNIGWALVNLVPLYPLDGGHVLYHAVRLRKPDAAWQVTRIAAIVVGVPLAFVAFRAGFTFAVVFIAFFVLQALTGNEPGRASGRVGQVADRARAQQEVSTKGPQGDATVAEAYQLAATANWNRFEHLVAGLSHDRSRQMEVAKLLAWRQVIENNTPATPTAPGLLGAVSGGAGSASPREFAALMSASLEDPEVLTAVVVLRARGQLGPVLLELDTADLERLEDRLVAGGLSDEQRIVAGALSVREETH